MASYIIRVSAGGRLRVFLGSLFLSFGLVFNASAGPAESNKPEYAIKAPLATRSLLLDGAVVDDLAVAVGERGHILISRDQGNTWTQANVATQATLTGVFFGNRSLGWAVGHDAVILRTRDGGENWERVHYAPEEERPLLDIWFKDAENGFAIGAYGYFLETADGGANWSSRSISEDDFHLNQITKSPTGRLYIAAEAGLIYRSDDEGETWLELPSPYKGSFFGTLPLDKDALLLFGLRGHLYRSENAGENWEPIATGTEAMLTDGLRLKDGKVVIVGLAGTVLISLDQGRTFAPIQQADRAGLASVVQARDGALILIGESGVKIIQLDR